ncbi:hypothetical protein [Desulfovibrio sp. ZJ200]|uniref:hypothetical protein n=1 Tax=Desulfovibrio sp. ZJ200 TaxID=2709792 RepID=UPI0013ED8D73|nr:hypothetical protein [Desulfovibrio sp. ZJ200]
MKKSVLLTLLEANDPLARALGQEISRMGADCQAHFWEDAPEKQAFAPVIAELCKPACGVWVIAGNASSFARTSIRIGLALTALAARHAHAREGRNLPVVLSLSGQGEIRPPTPLADAEPVDRGLGAKVTARLYAPGSVQAFPYRCTVHALPGLGLWLETGPADEPWQGALTGVRGVNARPDAHGVGQAGMIPSRCTLRHPVQGLRLTLNGAEYTAWGVQNDLSPAQSYFTRLAGLPEALVFGPYPSDDEAELYTLNLC